MGYLNMLKKSLIMGTFLASFLGILSLAHAMEDEVFLSEDGQTMTLTVKKLSDAYEKGSLEVNGKFFSIHKNRDYDSERVFFGNGENTNKITGKFIDGQKLQYRLRGQENGPIQERWVKAYIKGICFNTSPENPGAPDFHLVVKFQADLCTEEEINIPSFSKDRKDLFASVKGLKDAIDVGYLKVDERLYPIESFGSCSGNLLLQPDKACKGQHEVQLEFKAQRGKAPDFGSLPDNAKLVGEWCEYIDGYRFSQEIWQNCKERHDNYKAPNFFVNIGLLLNTKPTLRYNTNNSNNSNSIIDSSEKM